jgi:carbamoyltransferase
MKILGISAFYHDSAAAVLVDGKIIAAAQEERFTRIKHDAAFPVNAVKFCLRQSGLSIDDIDAIAFYDKPLLKFERLLETYYGFAPKGLFSFIKSMPVWIKEKLFLKRIIREELEKIETFDKRKIKFLFPEHHLSHSASAFFSSPFEEAAILTIDGVGEWTTASISRGKGNTIELLKELRFPHSVGLLYSAFTYFLGFKVNSGEYKLMGLAPYGNPDSPDIEKYVQQIKTHLVDIKEDGSIWLNQEYFNYAVGLRMAKDELWKNLFGFPRREEEEELQQHHCNLGYAIQLVTEEIVLKMAKKLSNSLAAITYVWREELP